MGRVGSANHPKCSTRWKKLFISSPDQVEKALDATIEPPEGEVSKQIALPNECERCASRITPLIYDEQDNMWFGLCTFCEEALNITSAGQVVSRAPLRKVLRDLVLKGDESIGQ